MSLNRIAARLAAVMALREAHTLVGDNVVDSQIGAIDVDADGNVKTDEDKPFIAVYTDGARASGDISGLRALVPNGETEFLFEAGISQPMLYRDPDTEEVVAYPGIPATDDAYEFYLDVVARQIGDALTDPENGWAEIFRSFVNSYESIDRVRTSAEQKGAKLAATQIKIVANLFADPTRGAALAPTHPLVKFFAKAATLPQTVPNPDYDPEDEDSSPTKPSPMAEKIALMQAQLSGDTHQWQLPVRRYGLTRPEADALLLTPHDGIADADVTVVEVNNQPAMPVG
jgi:hypothetical protein